MYLFLNEIFKFLFFQLFFPIIVASFFSNRLHAWQFFYFYYYYFYEGTGSDSHVPVTDPSSLFDSGGCNEKTLICY